MPEEIVGRAVELFHEDGYSVGIYYCSHCRAVHATKDGATQCHGSLICACGKSVEDRFYSSCRECRNAEWATKVKAEEAKRFEAAEKISEAEYGEGEVFDYFSDEYFSSLEELGEHYESEDKALPDYAWACKNIGVQKADIESVIEPIIAEMWEDADEDDLNGTVELLRAIDEFNKVNEGICVWQPDYSRAILIGKEN